MRLSTPHSIAAAALLLAASLAAPRFAIAQVWNETGDAGSLVSTAQAPAGAGALTSINGQLADSSDVDMYCLHVIDPANFTARLQCYANMGPNIWLFDATGKGLAHQDLCQAGDKDVNAFSIPGAGWYYVAVASSGMQAQSPTGAIWLTNVFNPVERAPDGPGAPGPLVGWAGPARSDPYPAYTIVLGGVSYCTAAVPVSRPTWGRLKSMYR